MAHDDNTASDPYATGAPAAQPVEGEQQSHEDEHGHNPHLAHHFDSMTQQFDSGKLGMWLFLSTEILLFGGLFAAYTIYRAREPELFDWGYKLLDWPMGFTNTLVLLFSSLTMAWAVRAAQLGQKQLLVGLLGATVACGGIFFVVKYFEYEAKWSHGIKLGASFVGEEAQEYRAKTITGEKDKGEEKQGDAKPAKAETVPATQPAIDAVFLSGMSVVRPPADSPQQLATDSTVLQLQAEQPPPRKQHIFFGIYYAMTGLHALHVAIGMGVLIWLMVRSIKGHFTPEYFTPVDIGGLYWHLVDLIWIFLFPLLYLIEGR